MTLPGSDEIAPEKWLGPSSPLGNSLESGDNLTDSN